MIPIGRTFYKMSGSGNDFVMVDAREGGRDDLDHANVIRRVCARGTGVGADGIVFLEQSTVAAVKLTYLNADGTRADFCGNATLCTTRLSVELEVGAPAGFDIETDSGIVRARLTAGRPEIDLQPVTSVESRVAAIPLQHAERQMGFALVGVPHLVIEVDDISTVDVVGRGRPLRSHPSLSHGANVNFVARRPDGVWRIRTYERGVEAETLACGSGSVATAIMLTAWGLVSGPVDLQTSSGQVVTVSLRRSEGSWFPSLRGEGRIVYQATLAET